MIWTSAEENIIIDFYADKGVNYCGELLDRSLSAIANKAKRLGISVKEPVIRRTKSSETYEQVIFEKDISYVPLEEYINARTPIEHECINGHIWKVSPNKILSKAANCPKCSALKFNPNKPCVLYLISFNNYYKVGITSKEIKETLGTDWTKFNMKIEWSIFYENGIEAYVAREKILNHFNSYLVDTDLLQSGNTEILSAYIPKEFIK